MKNKYLGIAALLSLIIYIAIIFLTPEATYPLPEQSKEDIYDMVHVDIEQFALPSIDSESTLVFMPIANNSIGRYVNKHRFTENQIETLDKEIPIYEFEIQSYFGSFNVHATTGLITKIENVYIRDVDIHAFVHNYYGDVFELHDKSDYHSFFTPGTIKYTFQAETTYDDIKKVVDVYATEDHTVTKVEYYGIADPFALENNFTLLIFFGIYALLFLIILALGVTIHLIIKIVRKEIEGVLGPALLALPAGFGWYFIGKVMTGGQATDIFTILESLLWTYIAFVVLVIRWKKRTRLPFINKVTSLKRSVWHAFLFTLISLALTSLFFYIASYFDTWTSPVQNHGLILNINIWLLPVFAFFIGLSAAIFEESIFRHYMIPLFDKGGVVLSVIATSFLWGILHVGYDMYPWYLYVLDFMLITGPLFYFVYKRYGFPTAIFLHFFYNAWVTTFFIFSVNTNVALVSLVVTLSPFLLFLYRTNEKVPTPK